MEERTVDARGQLCPVPLVMTRKAIMELAQGQILRVLVDNDISKKNIERFLSDNGISVAITTSGTVHTITINGTGAPLRKSNEEAYCSVTSEKSVRSTSSHILVFKSDKMGIGPDELRVILMKAFVNTIREVSPLPGTIVMYTDGVRLALDDSPVLAALQELEAGGVNVLVCGTCVNYYNVKDRVRVGTISNMYTILEMLSHASHIVEP